MTHDPVSITATVQTSFSHHALASTVVRPLETVLLVYFWTLDAGLAALTSQCSMYIYMPRLERPVTSVFTGSVNTSTRVLIQAQWLKSHYRISQPMVLSFSFSRCV